MRESLRSTLISARGNVSAVAARACPLDPSERSFILADSPLLMPFRKAWDALWDEVKAHPGILTYRETHTHVLLGHHLLVALSETEDLRPYQGCEVIFDDYRGLKMTGNVPWGLIGESLRPDILVRPTHVCSSRRRLAVELKCVRTTVYDREAGDEAEQTQRTSASATEIHGVKKDLRRLATFGELGHADTAPVPIMCVLHLHDDRFGRIPPILEKIGWQDVSNDEHGLTVRRAMAILPGDAQEVLNRELRTPVFQRIAWEQNSPSDRPNT